MFVTAILIYDITQLLHVSSAVFHFRITLLPG